jgi:hypothetical protein
MKEVRETTVMMTKVVTAAARGDTVEAKGAVRDMDVTSTTTTNNTEVDSPEAITTKTTFKILATVSTGPSSFKLSNVQVVVKAKAEANALGKAITLAPRTMRNNMAATTTLVCTKTQLTTCSLKTIPAE